MSKMDQAAELKFKIEGNDGDLHVLCASIAFIMHPIETSDVLNCYISYKYTNIQIWGGGLRAKYFFYSDKIINFAASEG